MGNPTGTPVGDSPQGLDDARRPAPGAAGDYQAWTPGRLRNRAFICAPLCPAERARMRMDARALSVRRARIAQ